MDANGLADPYVKLRLHPDSASAIKQKTERKQNTLNPNFEEDFF
jgi:Ca2+-dependent lipid-binding protein